MNRLTCCTKNHGRRDERESGHPEKDQDQNDGEGQGRCRLCLACGVGLPPFYLNVKEQVPSYG